MDALGFMKLQPFVTQHVFQRLLLVVGHENETKPHLMVRNLMQHAFQRSALESNGKRAVFCIYSANSRIVDISPAFKTEFMRQMHIEEAVVR